MRGVVAIDDAGTPGVQPASKSLHADRKSWAAVLIHPNAVFKIAEALRIFVDGVRADFGVSELHFPEIYGGRGVYKDVSIERRYELFRLMSELFRAFDLPIFFQTMSAAFLTELSTRVNIQQQKAGWFSLQNVDHVGLLLLLAQVREFLRSNGLPNRLPLHVVVDEGLVKAGGSVTVPAWADLFADGKLNFCASHEEVRIQLADFAAFSIARTQWLLASKKRKPRDELFLRSIGFEGLNVVNLPQIAVNLGEFTMESYEELLGEDRLLKGLPENP